MFKWQQVPSSFLDLLNNLTDLDNSVVWIISNHPPISRSSSPFTFGDFPNSPITIGVTFTFIFSVLERSLGTHPSLCYLLLCSVIYLVFAESTIRQVCSIRLSWLIVSFLSPHNQDLLFCCVLSIFALTSLVLMAFICAAIRRDSVSLFMFLFLSHIQVFSCEISLVCRLIYSCTCFSFHFYFLVIVVLLMLVLSVSILVAIISPSLFLFIDAIFHAGHCFSFSFSWYM